MTESLRYCFRRLNAQGWRYRYVCLMTAVHISPVLAWFFWTWQSLVLGVTIAIVHGLCVTLGYHRLLTHGSFETFPWLRRALALVPQLNAFDSGIRWTAIHRSHHMHVDTDLDPHSPKDSLPWGHFFCWFAWYPDDVWQERYRKFVPQLLKDPWLVAFQKCEAYSVPFMLALLFCAGYLVGGLRMAMSFVVVSGLFQMLLSFHFTWFVNSAGHMGEHDTSRTGTSKNVRWVNWFAFGEGWHKNHHEKPWCATMSDGPYQLDPGAVVLGLMEKTGLAWNVKWGAEDVKTEALAA